MTISFNSNVLDLVTGGIATIHTLQTLGTNTNTTKVIPSYS
jgi:hypothetical protein